MHNTVKNPEILIGQPNVYGQENGKSPENKKESVENGERFSVEGPSNQVGYLADLVLDFRDMTAAEKIKYLGELEHWQKIYRNEGEDTKYRWTTTKINLLRDLDRFTESPNSKEVKEGSEEEIVISELVEELFRELQGENINLEEIDSPNFFEKVKRFIKDQVKTSSKSFSGLRPSQILRQLKKHPEIYGAAAIGFVARTVIKGALGKGLAASAAAGGLVGTGFGFWKQLKVKRRREKIIDEYEEELWEIQSQDEEFDVLWPKPPLEGLSILLSLEQRIKERMKHVEDNYHSPWEVDIYRDKLNYIRKQKEIIVHKEQIQKLKSENRLLRLMQMSVALDKLNLTPEKREILEKMELGQDILRAERELERRIAIESGKKINLQEVAGSAFRGAAMGFAAAALAEALFRYGEMTERIQERVETDLAPAQEEIDTQAEVQTTEKLEYDPDNQIERAQVVHKGEGFWQPVETQLKIRLSEMAESGDPAKIIELKDKYHLTPEEIQARTPSFEKQVDNLVAELLRDNHIIDAETGEELRIANPGSLVVLNPDNTLSYESVETYQVTSGLDEADRNGAHKDRLSAPETETKTNASSAVSEIENWRYKPAMPNEVYAEADFGEKSNFASQEIKSPTLQKAALAWFGVVGITRLETEVSEKEVDLLERSGLYDEGFLRKIRDSWGELRREEQVISIFTLLNPKKAQSRGIEPPLTIEQFRQVKDIIENKRFQQAAALLREISRDLRDYKKEAVVLAAYLLESMSKSKIKIKSE